MAQTVLVSEMIADGKKLLVALDKTELKVTTAFWYYLEESESWRIVLSSPYMTKHDHYHQAFRLVHKAITENDLWETFDYVHLVLVSPKDEKVRLLRKDISARGKDLRGVRRRKSMIDRTYFEDVYVFRMI